MIASNVLREHRIGPKNNYNKIELKEIDFSNMTLLAESVKLATDGFLSKDNLFLEDGYIYFTHQTGRNRKQFCKYDTRTSSLIATISMHLINRCYFFDDNIVLLTIGSDNITTLISYTKDLIEISRISLPNIAGNSYNPFESTNGTIVIGESLSGDISEFTQSLELIRKMNSGTAKIVGAANSYNTLHGDYVIFSVNGSTLIIRNVADQSLIENFTNKGFVVGVNPISENRAILALSTTSSLLHTTSFHLFDFATKKFVDLVDNDPLLSKAMSLYVFHNSDYATIPFIPLKSNKMLLGNIDSLSVIEKKVGKEASVSTINYTSQLLNKRPFNITSNTVTMISDRNQKIYYFKI